MSETLETTPQRPYVLSDQPTIEHPYLPVRAEDQLPLIQFSPEQIHTPELAENEIIEAEYRELEVPELGEVETHLVEQGIVPAEEAINTDMIKEQLLNQALQNEFENVQHDLVELENIGEILNLEPETRQQKEQQVAMLQRRSERMHRALLKLPELPNGNRELKYTQSIQEMDQRLEEFDLALKRERERAVIRFIMDSTEDILVNKMAPELERSENAPQARQLIIFTIFHGVMKRAERYIKEGGVPDYSFELTTESVEHENAQHDLVHFITDIKIGFDRGGSYQLKEESNDDREARLKTLPSAAGGKLIAETFGLSSQPTETEFVHFYEPTDPNKEDELQRAA